MQLSSMWSSQGWTISFFFLIRGNLAPWKMHFVGSGERVKPRLCPRFLQEVHVLTRTQDLLCRSQALCHHAVLLEGKLDHFLRVEFYANNVLVWGLIFGTNNQSKKLPLWPCQPKIEKRVLREMYLNKLIGSYITNGFFERHLHKIVLWH